MKVLIIDDHFMVRKSLIFMLRNAYHEVECVEADNYYNAAPHFTDPDISLIILDIDIPGGTGTDMVKEIRALRDDVRILICSAADEERLALDYILAGANGYLAKASDEPEATKAVSTVMDGKRYVSPLVQAQLLEVFPSRSGVPLPAAGRLSEREKEVMHLLLKGKWTKEIAAALGLRANTISTFKARLFRKLGIQNLFELERRAKELGEFY
ncbi:response regulator transcription factor [Dyadobacter sp. 676]|uniref:Response regulator transcription factor n=1 Tax=Dyadobacter sp. 676 TaxID=3088362 RepID=A0AAU8FEQ2_9BACT